MLSSPLSRRRLLQSLAAAGLLSQCPRGFAQSEPRIAALDWTAVELLYALGIMPFAVSDLQGYNQWVVTPPLAKNTIELGLRNEPNLELLSQLRPDLMIVPDFSAIPEQTLQQFGKVWHFSFTQPGKTLLAVAQNNVQQLAQLLSRQTDVDRYLEQWRLTCQHIRQQLAPFRGRRILLYSFLSPRQVLVLTPSSLFGEMLEKLDLRCAWQGTANIWGSAVVGLEQLFSCPTDLAIEFTHGAQGETSRTATSGLWQAMPFVKQHKNYRVDGAWMYGGLEAAQRFAQQLLTLSVHWHE